MSKGYLLYARALGYRRLSAVDRDAGALVDGYLRSLIAHERSPYTIASTRSALRMIHQDWTLGANVTLPRRVRTGIRNNRGEAISRGPLDTAVHGELISFLLHTGLRRRECAALRAKHVRLVDRHVEMAVPKGKGGRPRTITPLGEWGRADGPLAVRVAGLQRNELVWPAGLPSSLRVQTLRRRFAQDAYRALSGGSLPEAVGALVPGSYDAGAALAVSILLGHGRISVVLTHYLR